MKIKKFRIWNYKSIIDSGDCYPAECVTILAGKNESGKSSILEALEDFNDHKKIREKAIPISSPEGTEPKISIWFDVPQNDLINILEETELAVEGEIPNQTEICITKTYPDLYSVEGSFVEKLKDKHDIFSQIQDAYSPITTPSISEVAQRLGHPIPVFSQAILGDFVPTFNRWQGIVTANLGNWSKTDQLILQEKLPILVSLLKRLPIKSPQDRFNAEIHRYVPNFILFSSFDDVFPNTISLGELKTNKWILDLQEMSDIDTDIITGTNSRDKKSHKTALNFSINEDFRKFWEQDNSNLSIDWDNEKLEFWIEEDGQFFEPEIRSQGRRWHLAFYIRVSARARENVRNIILIDEPGLYLHANAQRDVLKNLEVSGKDAPIIFSTHSPYLIEADKLERVRLIQKFEDRGTIIENKIHRVSDKETLTPILTAIGLELNRGIIGVGKENNIVVEGASDYYYLNAFKRLLNIDNLNFISGGSSGNMPKVGTILQGWGCKVAYLYDNDKAYKDAQQCIKKEWLSINKELLAKLPIEGAIEDVFTTQEFAQHVLEVPPEAIEGKNSDYMKGKDKVLKAKNFLEKVVAGNSITLSEESTALLNKLMGELIHRVKGSIELKGSA